jgi:hypothetical protein
VVVVAVAFNIIKTQLHQNQVWMPKPTTVQILLVVQTAKEVRAAHHKVPVVVVVSSGTDMVQLILRVIMENLFGMEALEEMEIQILGTGDLEEGEAFTGIIQVAEVEVAIPVGLEEETIMSQLTPVVEVDLSTRGVIS